MQEVKPRLALSIHEAAEQLGVSSKTVYRAIRSGQIPARRIGSRWFISPKMLDRWFEQDEAS